MRDSLDPHEITELLLDTLRKQMTLQLSRAPASQQEPPAVCKTPPISSKSPSRQQEPPALCKTPSISSKSPFRQQEPPALCKTPLQTARAPYNHKEAPSLAGVFSTEFSHSFLFILNATPFDLRRTPTSPRSL